MSPMKFAPAEVPEERDEVFCITYVSICVAAKAREFASWNATCTKAVIAPDALSFWYRLCCAAPVNIGYSQEYVSRADHVRNGTRNCA